MGWRKERRALRQQKTSEIQVSNIVRESVKWLENEAQNIKEVNLGS